MAVVLNHTISAIASRDAIKQMGCRSGIEIEKDQYILIEQSKPLTVIHVLLHSLPVILGSLF